MKKILKSLEDTKEFGINFGKTLRPGDVVCLNGDLGAGKTTLTKAIGLGLEVEDYITSPTFALINEYEGKFPVYHFDTYRLEYIEEVEDLGFDEYIYGNGVSIIEWADRIEKILPEDRIIIDIEKGSKEEERILNIRGFGKRFKEITEELER